MSRYEEADLSRVRTTSIRRRASKVREETLYRPPARLDGFEGFWSSLPRILGGADLRAVVDAVVTSRERGRPVLVLCGAHVLKTGMGPGLIRLLEREAVTGIAFHGAGAIHDVELGLWGRTSEEVADELAAGRFGMAKETADVLNGAAREAAQRREGLGEALGRGLLLRDPAAAARSVLAAAYSRKIPCTVHVAIGTDIVHQHPSFDGAATGEASARDFRILIAEVMHLDGGSVLNLGSAVVLPEVFLKAVSVARNLGAPLDRITTAVFDFIRHYRPMENVVRRPTMQGGRGYYLIGQHEILLPLFFHAWLREAGKRRRGPLRRGTNR